MSSETLTLELPPGSLRTGLLTLYSPQLCDQQQPSNSILIVRVSKEYYQLGLRSDDEIVSLHGVSMEHHDVSFATELKNRLSDQNIPVSIVVQRTQRTKFHINLELPVGKLGMIIGNPKGNDHPVVLKCAGASKEAGLKAGDVFVGLNGRALDTLSVKEIGDLFRQLSQETRILTVLRSNETKAIDATQNATSAPTTTPSTTPNHKDASNANPTPNVITACKQTTKRLDPTMSATPSFQLDAASALSAAASKYRGSATTSAPVKATQPTRNTPDTYQTISFQLPIGLLGLRFVERPDGVYVESSADQAKSFGIRAGDKLLSLQGFNLERANFQFVRHLFQMFSTVPRTLVVARRVDTLGSPPVPSLPCFDFFQEPAPLSAQTPYQPYDGSEIKASPLNRKRPNLTPPAVPPEKEDENSAPSSSSNILPVVLPLMPSTNQDVVAPTTNSFPQRKVVLDTDDTHTLPTSKRPRTGETPLLVGGGGTAGGS